MSHPKWGCTTQQTRGIHLMLFQCWPTVFDAGPTLKQHWVKALCLLGDVIYLSCPTVTCFQSPSAWPIIPCLLSYYWMIPLGEIVLASSTYHLHATNPANTIPSPNAGLMLGQRHRRWHSIKPTPCQRSCLLGTTPDPRARLPLKFNEIHLETESKTIFVSNF